MSEFFHGSRTVNYESGSNGITTVDSSTVGIIVTADDADSEKFPLNQLVGLAGYDSSVIASMGNSGTMAAVFEAIYSQGYAPLTAVVRVADAATAAERYANVHAGFQCLLSAQSKLGFSPRIIAAPNLDKELAVAKEVEAMADRLLAFAYIGVHADDEFGAVAARQNFGSERAMLLWPDFKNNATGGDLLASAYAVGLRVKLDNHADYGWHKTLSNVPVLGVSGISKDVSWHLQHTDHAAHYLNANEVTTLINNDGYRFWGNRTTAPKDSAFVFESYRRTGDILGYSFAQSLFSKVDGVASKSELLDIVDQINQEYKTLVNAGKILGGRCWLKSEDNPAGEVKAGRLVIGRNYTPAPPMEGLTQAQTITDEFIVTLF